MLRGIRLLAQMLAVNEASVVLQYTDVTPWVLASTENDKPLAGKSNQAVWSTLLARDGWENASPRHFGEHSGALPRIIRFYISIEDGECAVERDLGALRAALLEYRDIGVASDSLILQLSGPHIDVHLQALEYLW